MNNKTLHIMRGVSGAGKSTKVREIIGELSQYDFCQLLARVQGEF